MSELAVLKRRVRDAEQKLARAEGQLEQVDNEIKELGLSPKTIKKRIEELDEEIVNDGKELDDLTNQIEELLEEVDEEGD